MKTTSKFYATALTAIMLFAISTIMAQTTTSITNSRMGFKVGVGISGGLYPDKSEMDYGYGVDLKAQYDLTRNVAVTVSAGYSKLKWKNSPLNFQYILLMGGVKVFPIDRMYIGGELGNDLALENDANMNFIYSGGLGYDWDNGLDVGLKYERYLNNSSSSLYFLRTG